MVASICIEYADRSIKTASSPRRRGPIPQAVNKTYKQNEHTLLLNIATARYNPHMPSIYHPPVKRSMTIAGHETSISLEPLFWDALKHAAEARGLPINALVAQIDVDRLNSKTPCGLASAVRLWLAADA
jgi:predicted DNA-binding ribbon-helix-helix protein